MKHTLNWSLFSKKDRHEAINDLKQCPATTDHAGTFNHINGGSPTSSQPPTSPGLLKARQETFCGTSITGWQ
jgi:hypothetical protein